MPKLIFPTRIFVTREQIENEDPYLLVRDSVDQSDIEHGQPAAVYQLVERGETSVTRMFLPKTKSEKAILKTVQKRKYKKSKNGRKTRWAKKA